MAGIAVSSPARRNAAASASIVVAAARTGDRGHATHGAAAAHSDAGPVPCTTIQSSSSNAVASTRYGVNVRMTGRRPSSNRNSLPFHAGITSSRVPGDGRSRRTLAAGSLTTSPSSSGAGEGHAPHARAQRLDGPHAELAGTAAARGGSAQRIEARVGSSRASLARIPRIPLTLPSREGARWSHNRSPSTGDGTVATIYKEILIDAPAEEVWDALRDFGALHERLVPGFVVDDGRARPGPGGHVLQRRRRAGAAGGHRRRRPPPGVHRDRWPVRCDPPPRVGAGHRRRG